MNRDDILSVLKTPWIPTEPLTPNSLLNELYVEIHAKHPLYYKKVELLARRYDQDDILLFIPQEKSAAIVHLTWSMKKEHDTWPSTTIFGSLQSLEKSIRIDHSDYEQ